MNLSFVLGHNFFFASIYHVKSCEKILIPLSLFCTALACVQYIRLNIVRTKLCRTWQFAKVFIVSFSAESLAVAYYVVLVHIWRQEGPPPSRMLAFRSTRLYVPCTYNLVKGCGKATQLKFRYCEKATKFEKIFHLFLNLLSNIKQGGRFFPNLCGLVKISEL